ncbi:MAG: PQQ-binding-like beta-propeller repeat protein [Planctomycetes bacterium]|nr:PQQ-binding-like beta-propeller repeat protein [Planctomycetota bacterium]
MQTELNGPADEALLRESFRRIIERNLAFCLIVSDGISERIFYFAIGGIRVIVSGPRRSPSLGEELLERGIIRPEQFNQVNEATNNDPRRFAEASVQIGVCRADAIQEALVQQVEHELLDLFFWDGAELSLVEGQPPKSFYEGRFQTAALTCNVAALLQGVLERADVWRETVARLPNGHDVYESTTRAEGDTGGRHGRLVQLLDGSRTTIDAIEKSRMRRVPAFEFLMLALQQGKVRRTVGSAAQRVSREQLLRDIDLLEQALRQRVDATIVRRRLARTLEAVGEPSRAAAQWRELGDMARKVNELDQALDHYSNCVRVLPTDFATRELILEIYRHRKEYAQVVAHGRPLADLFLKHNLLNRAKQLLLQLVGLEPNDASLRRQLILVLIGLGERDLALRHLRELARLLEGRCAGPSEMKDVYVRILALDPRDKQARRRLDEITGVATQRRVLRLATGITAGLVLAIGSLFWFEGQARAGVNEAISDAQLMLSTKDLGGARKRLQGAIDAHPMARASRTAQQFLVQIERLQREQIERANRKARLSGQTEEPDEVVQRRERAEVTAAEMAKEATRLVSDGRIADAHRVYKELLTLHFGTRAADAARIPLSLQVLPRDARVILNGALVGTGSTMVDYSPNTPAVLEVELDGFERERITIDGLQPPEMSVALHRPVRWTAVFDTEIDAQPLVDGGVVFVAGRDRFVTALSVADGQRLWRTPLGLYCDVAAQPIASGDFVIVATASGELAALRRGTGEIAWRHAVCETGGVSVERPVLVAGDVLVVAPSDGSIVALEAATGNQRWAAPPRTLGAGSAMLLPSGQIGWIDVRGMLHAAAADTGAATARAATGAVLRGTPAGAAEDRLWALAEDDSLRLLTASAGTALRRFPVPRAFLDVQPATAGDIAYVVSQDGTVAALRASGDTVFRKRLDQPAPSGATVADGRVYLGGAAGRVSVLDAATGEESWRFDAGSRVTARPLVAGGTILVATAAGRLFALQE